MTELKQSKAYFDSQKARAIFIKTEMGSKAVLQRMNLPAEIKEPAQTN